MVPPHRHLHSGSPTRPISSAVGISEDFTLNFMSMHLLNLPALKTHPHGPGLYYSKDYFQQKRGLAKINGESKSGDEEMYRFFINCC